MADKVITVANIRPTGQAIRFVAGENGITPGSYLYADSADGGKLKLAKRNSTLAVASALYCSLSYADDEEPVYVQDPNSEFEPGFVVAAGEIYVLGTGFGGIEAVSDLAGGAIGSGHFLCVIGIGSTFDEATGTATVNKLVQIYQTAAAAHA